MRRNIRIVCSYQVVATFQKSTQVNICSIILRLSAFSPAANFLAVHSGLYQKSLFAIARTSMQMGGKWGHNYFFQAENTALEPVRMFLGDPHSL
ncbi:hypothetical protein BTW15_13395 [Pseudomonas syringae pv. tomato]|uniref:Uncharacterized protein n=1 Tax=Pseudomonas syringae pv. tomato TaxID=323 RepID=A0AB36KUA8_PSEUB|nr:hypothetical protein XJ28_14015 [Pseudomonas syringae pv. tomato]EEB58379.1 hypothetical protein PSPTOT1_1424 [Pseudomonas syringae pv. tomato T1]QBI63515.1 hypothetical protein EIZ61_19685 [Pseudomonas syringae]OPE59523.1 hypothetical protein BTW15_13395 [Pseudomonas syringae pv. tomato]RMQ69940.1 hypothetical protein ALQ00_102251 [Pseudomonas syringae pv. tomato]